jgi:hypothetical protein
MPRDDCSWPEAAEGLPAFHDQLTRDTGHRRTEAIQPKFAGNAKLRQPGPCLQLAFPQAEPAARLTRVGHVGNHGFLKEPRCGVLLRHWKMPITFTPNAHRVFRSEGFQGVNKAVEANLMPILSGRRAGAQCLSLAAAAGNSRRRALAAYVRGL